LKETNPSTLPYGSDNAGNMVDDYFVGLPWYTKISLIGLIRNPQIINQNITFFAIILHGVVPCECGRHGTPVWILLQHVTIPEDCSGYIGKHFISVSYENWQL